MQIGSDAERLEQIHGLELALASKEPVRKQSVAAVEDAKHQEAEKKKAVQNVESQKAGIGKEVHLRSRVAYLNGKHLDRGTLQLGNENIFYSGWRGQVLIPLDAIIEIGLGHSKLPPRVGVPILSRFWAGKPQRGAALLIDLGSSPSSQNTEESRLAVISDLREDEAQAWMAEIKNRQSSLGKVAERRLGLEDQHRSATASLAEATTVLAEMKSRLTAIDAEIAPLCTKRNQLIAQQRSIDAERERAARAARDAEIRRAKEVNNTKR